MAADPPRASHWEKALALAVYGGLSFILFIRPLLAAGFSEFRLGTGPGGDPQQYIWGLGWYPYALTRGLNPIVTRVAWAPTGYNLTWSTTVPGPSLLMWPVTRLFGPLVSYNLLAVTAPILGAFTAFLLCRYLAGAFWPALAGGYVYGFSFYELWEVLYNLDLMIIVFPPLIVYLVCLFVDRHLSGPRLVVLLAMVFVAQFLASTEILATTTVFGAAALAVVAWFSGSAPRERIRSLAGYLACAYGVAALVLAGYLASFVSHAKYLLPLYNPAHCSADLMGFLLPTRDALLGRIRALSAMASRAAPFCGPYPYVGLLPLVAVLFALTYRDRVAVRILLILLATIFVAALGPVVHVFGRALLPLPWLLFIPIPLVNNALPDRFTMYLSLVMGLVTALWLAEPGGTRRGRWLVAALTLITLLPNPNRARYGVREDLPDFFRNRLYQRYIAKGETILVLPYGEDGPCMLWQAMSDFHFRMAEAYFLGGDIPEPYARWPIVSALVAGDPYVPGYADQFRAFLAAYRVRTIIVGTANEARFRELLAALEARRTEVAGVALYSVAPGSLAPFSSVTAAAMERRYNLDRFRLLVLAARRWLDRGLPVEALSPFEAARLGLLTRDTAGYPWPPQLAGFGVRALLARSTRARILVAWIMRRYSVRYRIAAELGPAAVVAVSKTGVWLGPWSAGRIAVGVVGNRDATRAIVSLYATKADLVYYPYPLRYAADENPPDSQNLLLLVFRPEALRTLDLVTPAALAAAPAASVTPRASHP